jgi:hypothetical protein
VGDGPGSDGDAVAAGSPPPGAAGLGGPGSGPRRRRPRRHVLAAERIARLDGVAPGASARVRVVGVPAFLPRYAAMTLGRTVLVRNDRLDDDRLLAHELVHVEQWQQQGRARFLARYVGGYLRALVRERRHRAAYLAIPFEAEARARAKTWHDLQA